MNRHESIASTTIQSQSEPTSCQSGACGCASSNTPRPAGSSCCQGGGAGAAPSHAVLPSDTVYIFSRRQIRELDRLCVEEFKMPSILLMENAARSCAEVILEGLLGSEGSQGLPNPRILIVAGPGNNGGDGLAIARHLHNRGLSVAIVHQSSSSPSASGDAHTNLLIAQAMSIPIFSTTLGVDQAFSSAIAALGSAEDPDVVIDALLGTGLSTPTTGQSRECIARMNALKSISPGQGSFIIAIDVPSGLDCDSGLPAGSDAEPAVHAHLTITLAGVKAGFLMPHAESYVGDLLVADIGCPTQLKACLGRPLAPPSQSTSGYCGGNTQSKKTCCH